MKIIVKNRVPTLQGGATIAHNNDYVVSCVFDSDWDNNAVIAAIVVRENGKAYNPIILGLDRTFTLPVEETEGNVYVGFTSGNIKTTTPVRIAVRKSIKSMAGDEIIPEPTPTVYEQITRLVDSINEELKRQIGDVDFKIETLGGDYEEFKLSTIKSLDNIVTHYNQELANTRNAIDAVDRKAEQNSKDIEKLSDDTDRALGIVADVLKKKADNATVEALDKKLVQSVDELKERDFGLYQQMENYRQEYQGYHDEAMDGLGELHRDVTDLKQNTYTKGEVDEIINNIPEYDDKPIKDELAEVKSDYELYKELSEEELARFNQRVEELYKELRKNDRRITNLEYASDKYLYREEVSESEDYTKDIPSDVMPYGVLSKVGGKSIVWNQYFDKTSITTMSGLTCTPTGNGGYHLQGVATNNNSYHKTDKTFKSIAGHKYYIGFKTDYVASDNDYVALCVQKSTYYWVRQNTIIQINSDDVYAIYLYCMNASGKTVDCDCLVCGVFDLTQMFGSAIADTLTVEDCEKIFVNEYYTYSEPVIKSAEVDKVIVRGRNLYNHNRTRASELTIAYDTYFVGYNPVVNGITEHLASVSIDGSRVTVTSMAGGYGYGFYVPAKAGKKYTVSYKTSKLSTGTKCSYVFCNANNEKVSAILTNANDAFTVTAPNDAVALVLCLRYPPADGAVTYSDIMVCESETATEYTPYREPYEIPVPSIELLSSENVHDETDWENGKVIRRVGKVDFNTVNIDTSSAQKCYTVWVNSKSTNIIQNRFRIVNPRPSIDNRLEGEIYYQLSNDRLYLYMQYDSNVGGINTFRQWAINNLEIYYELPEPIIEDIALPSNILELEGGGSLTFHQTDDSLHLPVPNTENWLIKTGGTV